MVVRTAGNAARLALARRPLDFVRRSRYGRAGDAQPRRWRHLEPSPPGRRARVSSPIFRSFPAMAARSPTRGSTRRASTSCESARVSESAAPAIAYRNEVAGFVQPCSWTPDNRYVLTLLFRRDNISQIALIPAAGGAPRVLRSLNWVYPKRMDVSPDGRWIVYDNFAAEGKPERTIFLLAADGSTEKRLVEAAGNYLFPMWSANGRRVLFAGETDGQMELWAADVEAGTPRGAPYRVSGGLGRILPLGITNSDEVFYGVRTGVQDISVGGEPIRTRFAGRNSAPAWSRDGKVAGVPLPAGHGEFRRGRPRPGGAGDRDR